MNLLDKESQDYLTVDKMDFKKKKEIKGLSINFNNNKKLEYISKRYDIGD